jgi:biopolymer transport protein TolR
MMTSGVQVDLPESKAEALDQAQEPVTLTLDPAGAIFLNDQPVAADALGTALARIAAESSEQGGPRIYLRADQSLNYGLVIGVMGELNRAGLRKVALVSVAQEAGR